MLSRKSQTTLWELLPQKYRRSLCSVSSVLDLWRHIQLIRSCLRRPVGYHGKALFCRNFFCSFLNEEMHSFPLRSSSLQSTICSQMYCLWARHYIIANFTSQTGKRSLLANEIRCCHQKRTAASLRTKLRSIFRHKRGRLYVLLQCQALC